MEQGVIISPDKDEIAVEQAKCASSPGYFIDSYVKIDDPHVKGADWFPFRLWPAQARLIKILHEEDKIVVLKARQLGITWLNLAYALWIMIFDPGSMIMLFSKTGDDAKELMRRLKGMRDHLPEWLRPAAKKELEQSLELYNGSRAKSFKTTKDAGRSFTASFVLIDEAAFILFLQQLRNAAEATADAGGKLSIISTNDKDRPNNDFADLWKRSRRKESDYQAAFLAWSARPTRTREWYEHKVQVTKQDDLWQEYPAIPDQALAGRRANKRFTVEMITNARLDGAELNAKGKSNLPRVPGIVYYKQPTRVGEYIILVDPAEGDAGSDPSAIMIVDAVMWEEVAFAQGQWEPSVTASYAWRLAQAYNQAQVVVERNHHGHAVILALRDSYSYRRRIYRSPFDKKYGWHTNPRTKTIAYDKLAEYMSDGQIGFRSDVVLAQLANIDAGTQAAPEGDFDDAAMLANLAAAALTWKDTRRTSEQRRRQLATMTL